MAAAVRFAFKQTLIASVLDAGEAGEWIETASITGPSSMLPSVLVPFKETGVGANWEI